MCDSLFLECSSIKNIMLYLNNTCGFITLPVCYCALINGDSFIHVDVVSLFAIHVWHPHFPLNGIKKYSTL